MEKRKRIIMFGALIALVVFMLSVYSTSQSGSMRIEMDIFRKGSLMPPQPIVRRYSADRWTKDAERPNIVFILADDYGYHDIGYHGSEIKTPVMDSLAAEGVKLENYYVQPICSPSREQLMTGRYQIRTGHQHSILWPFMPSCLNLDEVTIGQKLKEMGYATHYIGKWHLGMYKKACWPTRRGFDTFFGFLLGMQDYYTHKRLDDYDFREQEELATGLEGKYATHLYANRAKEILDRHNATQPFFMFLSMQAVHEPLQVPDKYLKQYSRIKDHKRKVYAGMTTCMDEAVGTVANALEKKGLWNNTVLIFSTDNGGDANIGANNWPLRGGKKTLWEGGIRAVGFVNSPLLHPRVRGSKSDAMMHVTDWFPTLVSGVAGGSLNGTKPQDGYDMWKTISHGLPSPRTEILHNIDPFGGHDHPFSNLLHNNFSFTPNMRAAYREGDWKLLTGPVGLDKRERAKNGEQVWLFNIRDDPRENNNLADQKPDIVKRLMGRIQEYYKTSAPVFYPPNDPKGGPKNNIWDSWE